MLVASRNGLGIAVNEMQRSINGMGDHAPAGNNTIIPYGRWQPFDPGAITRGYAGLGDVPNDFEASVDLQYIPVRQGWYYGNPIDGRSYPTMQPMPSRGGLGDAATDAETLKLERTQTILQIISTVSIAAVATLAVIRAIRGPKCNGRMFGDGDDDDE
jgi:hypothetical protein